MATSKPQRGPYLRGYHVAPPRSKPMATPSKSVSRRRKKASARRRQPDAARPKLAAKTSNPVPSPVPSVLTHIDQRGEARMVDVSEKGATERIAIAEGRVLMRKETLDRVLEGNAMKGD